MCCVRLRPRAPAGAPPAAAPRVGPRAPRVHVPPGGGRQAVRRARRPGAARLPRAAARAQRTYPTHLLFGRLLANNNAQVTSA